MNTNTEAREQPMALQSDNSDRIIRAGAYAGPAFLAVLFANALYSVVFGGPVLITSAPPRAVTVLFALAALWIAWPLKDSLGRLAWILFAIFSGLHAFGAAPVERSLAGVLAALQLATGILLTVSGARAHVRARYARPALVFTLAFALVFLSRYWADVLLGTHSLMR